MRPGLSLTPLQFPRGVGWVFDAVTGKVTWSADAIAGSYGSWSADPASADKLGVLQSSYPWPSADRTFASGLSLNRASLATYFDRNGVLQSAASGALRYGFDPATLNSPLGVLIEESRTNSFSNPRAEGAVVGSPGTKPTGWLAPFSSAGLSYQIIGTGTENGIPYIDIRWYGTATSAGSSSIFFSNNGVIAAASGQTWTGSVYVRLVGGSLNGISSLDVQLTENNNSGSWLAATFVTITTNTAPLATQRKTATRTFNQASTAYNNFYFDANIINGATVDATFRIGAPQLELGAFSTSLILPGVGSPAATTRAADVLTAPLGRWWNPNAGCFVVEAMLPQTNPALSQHLLNVGDGTANNRISLYNAGNSNGIAGLVSVGGAVIVNQVGGSPTVGTVFKAAIAFNGAAMMLGVSGAVSTYAAAKPPGLSQLNIGSRADSAAQANGYIRRVEYRPYFPSTSELQALTT